MWTAVTPGGRISSTPSERIDREIVVHQLHADEPITAAEARQLARIEGTVLLPNHADRCAMDLAGSRAKAPALLNHESSEE